MKALFLAQGPLTWASSRYRAWWVAQVAGWADCVLLGEHESVGMSMYDVVIFPKTCDEPVQALARACRECGQWVIWDVCDPIWWLRPREARAFLPLVDHVVVSSEGLAADLRAGLGWPATVIPDRMDPAFHPTVKEHRPTAWPVLLWFGRGWNRLPSLSGALLTLHRLAAEGVRFRLRIVDDGAPGNIQVEGVEVEYHRWHLETFHAELLAADAVLAPAYPGPWGRMKSINRQVGAWWTGLPTSTGEDPAQLKLLLADARFRAEVGLQNRRLAEERYDVAQSAVEWEALLGNLVNDSPPARAICRTGEATPRPGRSVGLSLSEPIMENA